MRKRPERLITLLLLTLSYTSFPVAATPLATPSSATITETASEIAPLFASSGRPVTADQTTEYVDASPVPFTTDRTASDQTPTSGDISTLMTVTGITAQLPHIYDMLVNSRNSNSDRCKVREDLIRDSKHFHPQQLQTQVAQLLQSQLSKRALNDVLRWYDSELGKRVHSSEKKARDDASFEIYLNNAAQTSGWRSRIKSIAAVEKHTRANHLGTVTGVEIEYGGLVLSGCIEAYAENQQQTDSENSREVATPRNREADRAKMTRADLAFFELLFYQDTLDSMAFSLQDLSDEDMANYAKFVSGANARHVFGTLVDAVTTALRSASTITSPKKVKQTQTNTANNQHSGSKIQKQLSAEPLTEGHVSEEQLSEAQKPERQLPETLVPNPLTTQLDH